MNKKLIKLFIGVFALSLIVSCATTETKKDETDPVMIELQKQVDALNDPIPRMVGEGLRLDKVSLEPNRTIVFSSTAMNVSSPKDIPFSTDAAKEGIINAQLKTNPAAVENYIEKKITLKYVYLTNKAEKIAEIVITPEDWQEMK